MKREDTVKAVLDQGSLVRVEIPVTLKAIKQKSTPVRIGQDTVDRDATYLRLQLPSGDFLDCRVEGLSGNNSLLTVLVKDPYFKTFFDATQPRPEEDKSSRS